jgi:hypothetical protein
VPEGIDYYNNKNSLPSRKTLMAILHKIPLECGLNKVIIQSLRTSVERLKLRDRHCILMFDEMSLQSSLTYNKSGHCIDWFHELCGEKRTCKIADQLIMS